MSESRSPSQSQFKWWKWSLVLCLVNSIYGPLCEIQVNYFLPHLLPGFQHHICWEKRTASVYWNGELPVPST